MDKQNRYVIVTVVVAILWLLRNHIKNYSNAPRIPPFQHWWLRCLEGWRIGGQEWLEISILEGEERLLGSEGYNEFLKLDDWRIAGLENWKGWKIEINWKASICLANIWGNLRILGHRFVLGTVWEGFRSTVWLQEAPRQGSERAGGPKHRPKEVKKTTRKVPRCTQGPWSGGSCSYFGTKMWSK